MLEISLVMKLKIKEKLIANIKSSFHSFGYKDGSNTTFEYVDVFSVGKNTSQKPSLYNLIIETMRF